MPMPKPETGESQDDFISRCMGDETMRRDYPDQEQRSAVCYTQWREREQAKGRGYEIKVQAKEAEIWLYDEIGSGWFGGVSAKKFADDLKSLGKLNRITLRINSPGGDVFDGIAIYNVLKQNSAQVVVNIDGLAASIASIIAMAGDEINMAGNATMMIHKAWGISMGNADDMAKMAETLTKLDGTLAGTYMARTGLKWDEIIGMMQAETWMNAQEAYDYGFVDSITDELKLAAHFDLDKFKYRNAPPAEPGGIVLSPDAESPGLEVFDEAIKRCEAFLKKENKN